MVSSVILKNTGLLFDQFHPNQLDELLCFCAAHQVSDVTLQAGQPVFAERYGVLQAVTSTVLTAHDIKQIALTLYGPNAMAQLSHNDLDFSYEIKVSRQERLRFRVNITTILIQGHDSYQLTFRILPTTIPDLTTLDFDPAILAHCWPRQGLILVTGPTGSGKTTLLASLIQHHALHHQSGKILTYESPIEYVYDQVKANHGLISQSEIPKHLPSYERAIRNALRRKPAVIVAGEARDGETITGMLEAALTGHLVLSTTHTNGVAETVSRLLSAFGGSEKTQRAWDLIDSLRLIISQTLVPCQRGGRMALREWLACDTEVRHDLSCLPLEQWSGCLRQILTQRGTSFQAAAMKAHQAKTISDQTLNEFRPL